MSPFTKSGSFTIQRLHGRMFSIIVVFLERNYTTNHTYISTLRNAYWRNRISEMIYIHMIWSWSCKGIHGCLLSPTFSFFSLLGFSLSLLAFSFPIVRVAWGFGINLIGLFTFFSLACAFIYLVLDTRGDGGSWWWCLIYWIWILL